MLKYIAATHRAADEGFTLKRMELERRFSMSDDDGAGGNGRGKRRPTPGEAIMRMNCKLTLLTREMLERERGIAQVKGELAALSEREVISTTDGDGGDEERGDATDDDDSSSSSAESSYEEEPTAQVALSWCVKERTPARDVASDMLVAFFSVLTGHPVGYRAFVDAARRGYELGISCERNHGGAWNRRNLTWRVRAEACLADRRTPRNSFPGLSPRYTSRSRLRASLSRPRRTATRNCSPTHACRERQTNAKKTKTKTRRRGESTDDAKRRATRGLRLAVDSWLEMDRETLTDEVSASLSEDEGDEDVAKPFAGASSSSSDNSLPPFPTDGSFAVVRDEAFGASSITLATLRHQRNIVSFIRNSLAKPKQ
jgi:hypothetical protein